MQGRTNREGVKKRAMVIQTKLQHQLLRRQNAHISLKILLEFVPIT